MALDSDAALNAAWARRAGVVFFSAPLGAGKNPERTEPTGQLSQASSLTEKRNQRRSGGGRMLSFAVTDGHVGHMADHRPADGVVLGLDDPDA